MLVVQKMRQKIRHFLWKYLEKEVLHRPKNNSNSAFLRLLASISIVYGKSSEWVKWGYESHYVPRNKLPIPVISVGNFTWGGTGKTPMTEYIAKYLHKQDPNRTPLILSRGYGKDECVQSAVHVPQSIVGIGANRFEVATKLLKQNSNIGYAILDDGMQHHKLFRNLEIVMLDAINPFGNSCLIPRGILRETPETAIRRTDILCLHNMALLSLQKQQILTESINRLLKHAENKVLVVHSISDPCSLVTANSMNAQIECTVDMKTLQSREVFGFCGIGSPESFRLNLINLGVQSLTLRVFPDHHLYSTNDLAILLDEIKLFSSLPIVVTTEKDYYRCPEKIRHTLSEAHPLILKSELKINSGEEMFLNQIVSVTKESVFGNASDGLV